MSYLKIPADRYDKLQDLDTKIIQMNICDYITHLKNSGVIASRSIAVYLSAIRKFYSMNDIQLNWDKIHSYQPERATVRKNE
jgi:site-specific recombinase XerD